MPLFICDNCGAIDNTATGFYWSRNHIRFKDPEFNGKALCCECTPEEFEDGSKTEAGKWHGHFPKEIFDPEKHNREDFING